MIKNNNCLNKNKNWEIGMGVDIGFMKNLRIKEIKPNPNKYLPDIYLLVSSKGKEYEFTPYYGLYAK